MSTNKKHTWEFTHNGWIATCKRCGCKHLMNASAGDFIKPKKDLPWANTTCNPPTAREKAGANKAAAELLRDLQRDYLRCAGAPDDLIGD
jgi:hypothetical protein